MNNWVLKSSIAAAILVTSFPTYSHGVDPRCRALITSVLAAKSIYTDPSRLLKDLSMNQPDQNGFPFIAMMGFMAVEMGGTRQHFFWQVPLTNEKPLLGIINNHQVVTNTLRRQDPATKFICGGSFRMMITDDGSQLRSKIKFVQMTNTLNVFDTSTFTPGHLVSALHELQRASLGLNETEAFDIGWTGFSSFQSGRPVIPNLSVRDLIPKYRPE